MGFFDNLTESGGFFFWIFIFLIFILLCLSIFLLYKNKKLKELVEKEKDDNFYSSDEENFNIDISDGASLNCDNNIQITEEVNDTNNDNLEVTYEKDDSENEVVENIQEDNSSEIEDNKTGAYQKNVLREMSKRMPISPIHIDNSINSYNDYDDNYGLDETFMREDSVSPLESMEDVYDTNDNMKFASDIVSRMEEGVASSNIELTDYEKKQEEEAIISYDELQKVKDKIYNITEEEDTDDFIDELRNFRSDL